MKPKIILLFSILALSMSYSNAIVHVASAYQFRTCYRFNFNQNLLQSDAYYTVLNNENEVLESGTLNRNNSDSIHFCDKNKFEFNNDIPKNMAPPGRDIFMGLNEQKFSDYTILLEHNTQKDVMQTSQIDFHVDHDYTFVPNDYSFLDPDERRYYTKAVHGISISITHPISFSILNDSKPIVRSMVSDKYYSINQMKAKYLLLDNGWVSGNAWFTSGDSSAPSWPMPEAPYFLPRFIAAGEYITFDVSYDTNPFQLLDVKSSSVKTNSSLNFDYMNKKETTTASPIVDSNYIVNVDFFKDPNHYSFKVNNINTIPYGCTAFDYDEKTKNIYGYCISSEGSLDPILNTRATKYAHSVLINCPSGNLTFPNGDPLLLECVR